MGEEPGQLRAALEKLRDHNHYEPAHLTEAEAEVVLAEVERLARDNEEMSLAMSSVHVGNLMDALAASEAECERLAGRVAALETALAEAADWLDEDLYDGPDCDVPLAAVAQADRSLVASWREVLADVGGSE